MRIKQLELNGFKSFPQRAVLDFRSGVTGVVGPNGCGKSNIVDAIRWVLGEQSAKHLRGEGMDDVIFNGNERTPPMGMAEVSLTFENDGSERAVTDLEFEASTLPAHFRNLSEIRVTRRYYRSGESEYFINKTSCRLKDITELFLGTGVGAKAYAIIPQDKVQQLINAKPEDRRLFIEEAAGTTLYRSRKFAAERKMERTRENLTRINDVLREIDRQLQYLQRQAKKAEEYRRLQQQVRELDLALTHAQWQRLQVQLAEIEAAHDQRSAEEQRLTESVAAWQEQLAAASDAVAAAEERQSERREALAVLDAERERVRERLAMLAQERAERERRIARLKSDLEVEAANRARLESAQRQAERERQEWGQFLLFDEGDLQRQEADLMDARGAVSGAQSELDRARGALVEHMARQAEARTSLAALQRRHEDMLRHTGKLRAEDEAIGARLAQIEALVSARRADVVAMRERMAAAAGEKETRAEQLRALAEARRRWEREANMLESAMLQARSRLESLEEIQRNYEGFNRGVRSIMREEQPSDGVLGVVADVIDIPQQYERAVAAVLGERLQYVIVRGEEEGLGAVDLLRRQASGRGSFIPVRPRRNGGHSAASLNGCSRPLLDLVGVNDHYRAVAETLLDSVALVPDLRTAVELWRKNGVHVTLVTPEGDVVDPTGVITGGSDRPIEEEILARRREIESLRLMLAEGGAKLEAVQEEVARIAAEIDGVQTSLRDLDQGVHELTLQIVAAEKDIEHLEIERPQCLSRREVARYEIATLEGEATGLSAELAAVELSLAQLVSDQQQLEQDVSTRLAAFESARARSEALSAEVTAVKVRVAERRERQQAAAAAAEALRAQQAELDARRQLLADDLRTAAEEIGELERAIEEARVQATQQERRRGELQADVEAAAEDVRRLIDLRREEEQRGRALQAARDETRSARAQLELARSEARLRGEHLVQTVQEKYSSDLSSWSEEGAVSIEDEGEALARLDALKVRLGRIGEVNVGAIDELRELEERSSFLRTQRDDLERSLADLERTIHKLNRVSRARFAETFARANETFQKVFPRLFRGGEAKLVLTDEQNLLESGVEIVVRPPGKRLDTVALLSGGEKALVAVSLIFSLFLINPTPFCILDEVDAPLDDANIGRFSQLIREMSDRLQFVVITHNKRTMEAADVLYGITMQEPGVSSVISVAMK